MRLIDADALRAAMYHEAFENEDSYNEEDPQARWDSGLWVRYKMFERCLESAQQKKLKYSGFSICIHCTTVDCYGCLFEPTEGILQ